MVNWTDPATIIKCNEIFKSLSHVAIGAYLWEAFSSIGFEWSLITRKRGFKWPMLIYCYCKWVLCFAFVGMLIALNNHSPTNCQALYNFNQFAGNSSLGAASTLLMLRSIAIWNRNKWIAIIFIGIGAGLWGVLMHGVTTVRANWDDGLGACNVEAVTPIYLSLVYLYTMFTDLTVLLVTLAGLSWNPGRSGLWRMLWDQGILYFVVAFIANLIPAVMLLIDLNPVLNIMFSIPAIAATCTCACRCFVRLSEYARRGDELSAALQTNPTGWTHRLQGPGKGSKIQTTGQFKRDGFAQGQGQNGQTQTVPGQTDTIDGILRSMSLSAQGGGISFSHPFDPSNNIRLTELSKNKGSDDTLSISPSDPSPLDTLPQLPQVPQLTQRRDSSRRPSHTTAESIV